MQGDTLLATCPRNGAVLDERESMLAYALVAELVAVCNRAVHGALQIDMS